VLNPSFKKIRAFGDWVGMPAKLIIFQRLMVVISARHEERKGEEENDASPSQRAW
jgi:hypothetical protein